MATLLKLQNAGVLVVGCSTVGVQDVAGACRETIGGKEIASPHSGCRGSSVDGTNNENPNKFAAELPSGMDFADKSTLLDDMKGATHPSFDKLITSSKLIGKVSRVARAARLDDNFDALYAGDKVVVNLGKYHIEECGEEEMQQNLHPLFSRLCIYTFLRVTDKNIMELKRSRCNNNISNTETERLMRVDIDPRSIEASIYKKAFNTLFCAACYFHLKGTGDNETKLKELAGETLRIVRPEMADSLMKCLASKFTEILLEYSSENINNDFKISYSSTLGDIWTVHCSSPRLSMKREIHCKGINPALHYTLSHQQLDCKLQLHHSIKICGNAIEVEVKIGNLRCKAIRLDSHTIPQDSHTAILNKFEHERYFPAKISVTTGPETGRSAFHAVNSGASSSNPTVNYSESTGLEEGSKTNVEADIPLDFKVMVGEAVRNDRRNTNNNERRNWHFELSAYDNTQGRFQWTLYHHSYQESPVYSYCPERRDEQYRAIKDLAHIEGPNSPFTEERGIEFAGDMYGTPIKWTFNKEIEGKTLNWFVECQIWMAYYPSRDSLECMETRCQNFREVVQLPLKAS